MNQFQTDIPLTQLPGSLPTEQAATAATTIASLLWNLVTPEGTSLPSPTPSWSYELKDRFSLSLTEHGTAAHSTSSSPSRSRVQKPIESPLNCYAQVQSSRVPIKSTATVAPTSQSPVPPNLSKTTVTSSLSKESSPLPSPPAGHDLATEIGSRAYRDEASLPKPDIRHSSSLPHSATAQKHPSVLHPTVHSPHTAIAQFPAALRSDQDPRYQDDRDHQRDHHEEESLEIEGTGARRTQRKVDTIATHHFQNISRRANTSRLTQDPYIDEFLSSISPALSEALGRQASHFDILLICIALMKLDLESQEEEKLSRRVERTVQLRYLEKEAANFKSQAKSLLFSHVGAGILGVVGGFLPILGLMKGDSILNGLSGVFSSLSGKKSKDVFDGFSKMMQSISETQKASGQIYGTFAEADRTRYNRFGDIHSRDQEERTRALEQLQEKFRGMERFLLDLLQMRHDVASQLYR